MKKSSGVFLNVIYKLLMVLLIYVTNEKNQLKTKNTEKVKWVYAFCLE